MRLKFLLDTNVVSEPLKPKPNGKVLRVMKRHHDEFAVAAIVWHELLTGCYRLPPSARRSAIEGYLFGVVAPAIPILAYDEAAAHWHARERARLAEEGKTPSFPDGQIAAVAAVNELTLVTFNVRDFVDFAKLNVQDWRL